MKNFKSYAVCLIAAIIGAATVTPAQSQNREALRWFNSGVAENDSHKKIQAYLQAIALDPQFVEALYNLGMVYKTQQDYANAEKYFYKAFQSRSDKTSDDLKLQIIYELATTYSKLGKLADAEEALRSAKTLARNGKVAGMVSYTLGRLLYEQNRYDEALMELQNCARLHPENQGKFADLIYSLESTMALQPLYEKAKQARLRNNPVEAKALFEQIRASHPQFRDVQAQLAEIEAERKQLATRQAESAPQPKIETDKDAAALYAEAKRHETAGNREQALALYEKLTVQSGLYEEAGTRIQALKQQLEQERVQKQMNEQYRTGMAALDAQDWTRAIIVFESLSNADRNFRDVRQRLAEAQRELDRESSQAIAARFYAEGNAALKSDELESARAAFEKVRKINPNYRNLASLMSEVENARRRQSQSQADKPGVESSNVRLAPVSADSLYQTALAQMVKENWTQAALTLEKLQEVQPQHRDAVDLLARTRAHLGMTAKIETSNTAPGSDPQKVVLYLCGGFLALLIVGIVFFSSATRARLHLWRGNLAAAEKIYEKMLAHQPQQMNLYPQLAGIYLRTSRHDDQAMKVYKKALQADLPNNQRKAIRAFVGQNHSDDGQMKSEERMDPN